MWQSAVLGRKITPRFGNEVKQSPIKEQAQKMNRPEDLLCNRRVEVITLALLKFINKVELKCSPKKSTESYTVYVRDTIRLKNLLSEKHIF